VFAEIAYDVILKLNIGVGRQPARPPPLLKEFGQATDYNILAAMERWAMTAKKLGTC